MNQVKLTNTFKSEIRKFKSHYYNLAPVLGLLSLSPDRVKKEILDSDEFGKIFVTRVKGGIIILWQKQKDIVVLRNIIKS